MTYEWTLYFCLFLALWSAVIGGVFSAFSEFVMSGLLRTAPAGGIEAFVQLGLHFFQQGFLLGKLLLQSTLSFGEGGQFFSCFVQMGAFSLEILFGRTQFGSKHIHTAIADWLGGRWLFGFGQMHHARAKCDTYDDSNNQADVSYVVQ